jgi:hypothetical protein
MNSQNAQELGQINKNKFKPKPNHTTNVPYAWNFFFVWRLKKINLCGISFFKLLEIEKNCIVFTQCLIK